MGQTTHNSDMMMETERMDGEDMARLVQGSLLNKVYAMQHDRERENALMTQLTQLTVSPSHHQTSSDKLMISSPPLNTAMSGEQQDMEVPPNPAYTQYMLERSLIEGTSCDPESQEVKRSDPVYLTSMASHGVWHNGGMNMQQVCQQQQQQLAFQQQQQLELQHQQQLELQQRSCHSQILAEQLGGFVLPNRQPDLIPFMDSMQLE